MLRAHGSVELFQRNRPAGVYIFKPSLNAGAHLGRTLWFEGNPILRKYGVKALSFLFIGKEPPNGVLHEFLRKRVEKFDRSVTFMLGSSLRLHHESRTGGGPVVILTGLRYYKLK